MTTTLYPDVSHYNPQYIPPVGTFLVMAKATEGTSYADPYYSTFKNRAAAAKAMFAAYHWLTPGTWDNIYAQARWAFSHVGPTIPLMLDCEAPGVTALTMGEIYQFVDSYRFMGGRISLIYLPRWYWNGHMGSPSLSGFNDRGLKLVASEYRAYDESQWPSPYGGVAPYVWQYTDNAFGIDGNAFTVSREQFLKEIFGEWKTVTNDEIIAVASAVVQWATPAGALPGNFRGADTNLITLEAKILHLQATVDAVLAAINGLVIPPAGPSGDVPVTVTLNGSGSGTVHIGS